MGAAVANLCQYQMMMIVSEIGSSNGCSLSLYTFNMLISLSQKVQSTHYPLSNGPFICRWALRLCECVFMPMFILHVVNNWVYWPVNGIKQKIASRRHIEQTRCPIMYMVVACTCLHFSGEFTKYLLLHFLSLLHFVYIIYINE